MKPLFNPDMRLSEHFTLGEFLRSNTAEAHHLSNTPLKHHIMRMQNLAKYSLEPTRQKLCLPIFISSGFRCPELNTLVKGVSNSQHMLGEAADTTIPEAYRPFGHKSNEQAARLLFSYMQAYAEFDQLILEHYGTNSWWVHISCRIDLTKNRHQIINDLIKR